MFKVGDEVLIKGKVVAVDVSKNSIPYWVGVSNGMGYWLSEADITDKTYEKGLADAWELAKKIYDMNCDAIKEIFGVVGGFWSVVREITVEEALAKIKAYENENEIKVGDEVVHGEGSFQTKFTVTFFERNKIEGFDENGNTHSFCYPNPYIKKTGKHIDIEGLLRQIGE